MASRHILSVLIENASGALSRVVGLFSARGYNIESLTVAPTENEGISRMTIVSFADDVTMEQITKQLNRLIEVVKVYDLMENDYVERELMLVKVRAIGRDRDEMLRVSEIFRAGIQAVDKGQMEAGRSLGLSWMQTMRYIILPQAFKNVIPPLGNEFISMTKETSLVSVIGFEELTRRGQLIIAKTYGSFEIWMTVAALYLIMTLSIAQLVSFLERRFATDDRN